MSAGGEARCIPVGWWGDPEAPAVLFCLGDPTAVNRHPTVALIGTRSPTRYGIGVAAQFGADLGGSRGERRLWARARYRRRGA